VRMLFYVIIATAHTYVYVYVDTLNELQIVLPTFINLT